MLEIRGQSPGYLKVYDYHRERGGYLRNEMVHIVTLTPAEAPGLLAVLRFLRDGQESEALGISYGAAYLRATGAGASSAEVFDAIAGMAERLADQASSSGAGVAQATGHLEVVEQFGVHTRSFERNGRIQVCYGTASYFRRLLALAGAAPGGARAAARSPLYAPGLHRS